MILLKGIFICKRFFLDTLYIYPPSTGPFSWLHSANFKLLLFQIEIIMTIFKSLIAQAAWRPIVKIVATNSNQHQVNVILVFFRSKAPLCFSFYVCPSFWRILYIWHCLEKLKVKISIFNIQKSMQTITVCLKKGTL